MALQSTNILILDDESEIRSEINEFLTSDEFEVKEAATPKQAFRILSGHPIDIAVLDLRLPEMNGLEVLKQIRNTYPHIQVIMMSGHGDMGSVIQALRLGAVDYFQKPFHLKDMYRTILKSKKYIDRTKPFNSVHSGHVLQHAFGQDSSEAIIVMSPAMKIAVERMRLVSRSIDTTVLIRGESGTGKELIARGIHYLSARKDKPFHAVNCSTMPDELFESEFFGYKKGAFTGATTDKPGWFEAADGGTLFLDEIGDLKPNLQAKLLRIMEDKVISRLGSVTTKKVDVRVITATNQDLEQLISGNRFRQDLYHRLNTIVINIPPLRECKEGIPVLFSHFLNYYSNKLGRAVPEVDKNVMDALMLYDFPGNVRELKQMVERAMVLSESDTLTFEHFEHLKIKIQHSPAPQEDVTPIMPLDQIEKETIEAALKNAGYNKSHASRTLNISRQSLDRRIEKLGIVVSSVVSSQ
jgi:DNA-binding NtrC family response regulator